MTASNDHGLAAEDFVHAFFGVWDEIVGSAVAGPAAMFVLDEGGSFVATLDALDARTASTALVPGATTIAAHVAHAAYYLETFEQVIMNRAHARDWPASFQPAVVDDEAWESTRARLRGVTSRIEALIRGNPAWRPEHLRGAMTNLAHLAYHLGAVRQIVACNGKRDT